MFSESSKMWLSMLTTVLTISFMVLFMKELEGTRVQEWNFKANGKLAYLVVTALTKQREMSLFRCDDEFSQCKDCKIIVYNQSTSLCAMVSFFRAQEVQSILNGDSGDLFVVAQRPDVRSCFKQPPSLNNAFISPGNMIVGCVRRYTCFLGYRDISTDTMTANTTCLENLTWSAVSLNCSIPSCPSQPPTVKHAIVSDGSDLVGSIRTYTCHHGYRDTSSNHMTANTMCLGNLAWSHVTLKCLAERCPSKLPSVPNAHASSGNRNIGSSRRYTCHRGYRDKSTGLNFAHTRCLHSLRWSRPNLSCSAQGCPGKPPHIENAHVSGRGSSVGSVRKYTCRKGYMDTSDPKGTNEARCRENFRWSQPGLHCSGPWLRKETEATKKGRKYVELTEEELKHVFADTTLIFQVKTCHSANINYGKYELRKKIKDKISIGGGKNTFYKVSPCVHIKESNIVSCEEFRSFWIKFNGTVVRVGKGEMVGERQVIICKHPYKVVHLRISTGVRDAGVWLFKLHGG